jgi:hypothetical protein
MIGCPFGAISSAKAASKWAALFPKQDRSSSVEHKMCLLPSVVSFGFRSQSWATFTAGSTISPFRPPHCASLLRGACKRRPFPWIIDTPTWHLPWLQTLIRVCLGECIKKKANFGKKGKTGKQSSTREERFTHHAR